MSEPNDKTGIGARVLRKEDYRFLTGTGRFIDDIAFADGLECTILRSPHAHAEIVSIDKSKALALPGVSAVLTGEDLTDFRVRY